MVDDCQSNLVNVVLGMPKENSGLLVFPLYILELFYILEN